MRISKGRISVRLRVLVGALGGVALLGIMSGRALASDDVPRQRIESHELAPFPYGDPDAVGLTEEALAGVSDHVADWVARGQIVGAEIMIVKDDTIVWHEVMGLGDLETRSPLRPAGVYRIRSMTKPVLGTSVLRLVDQGLIGLDDAVSEYIPAFDAERSRDVTIRRLLSHTAGFGFSSFPRDRREYDTLRASVDDLATVVPEHPAGEFRYSDGGSATLGALVETVTGEPVETYMQREIFDRLGMADTHAMFAPDAAWAARVVSTHRWDAPSRSHQRYWDPSQPQEMPYFRASGGLYSTVFDYAVFLDAWQLALQAESDEFLSVGLARAALSPIPGVGYGMHWEVARGDDGSAGVFGHGGSDGTMALCIPDEDLLLLFFTQSRGCDCRDQFAMLAGLTDEFGALSTHLTWGRWRADASGVRTIALDEAERSRLLGMYDVGGQSVEIRDEGGALTLVRGVPASSTAGPQPSEAQGAVVCRPALALPFASVQLVPIGESEFLFGRIEGDRLVEVYWPDRPITFHDIDGRIVGYSVEYEPGVVERARKYEWRLAAPPRRQEPLPAGLLGVIDGRYESGLYGVLTVRTLPAAIEIDLGNETDELWFQGGSYFASAHGELVTFDRDQQSGRWRLHVLDPSGRVFTYERWEGSTEP
ncbi:MAG: serine hydrolase domain-containing protein [Phycisphaerales bacterium]